MSKCREEFYKWYEGFDSDLKVEDVLPIWQAAWNAATKNAVEICEGQMTGVNPVGDMAREECAEAIKKEDEHG